MNNKHVIISKFYTMLLLIGLSLFTSCISTKQMALQKDLNSKIQHSSVFSKIFTGFVLYDPVQNKELINIDGHKYYTPASNTKILSFYTSLNVLGDSMPLVKYETRNDSLFFSGTGNPLTLNPFFQSNNQNLIQFLSRQNKKLFYCSNNFDDEIYGPGWAWDDHLYSYQTEKDPLPLYGSLIHIEGQTVSPSFFQDSVRFLDGKKNYSRGNNDNQFELTTTDSNFIRDIPFHQSKELTRKLLTAHIEQTIHQCPDSFSYQNPEILKQEIPDSLYGIFLQESDNFIGEQLMLMNSFTLFDTMDVARSIQWAQDSLLHKAPDSLRWVDGSGLSRYNLFTPSSLIYVLDKILNNIGIERIMEIFPAGGKNGTIKDWYYHETPYIYAKTGTLSNKHCLSGYLITKKGKVLIFSFMNNNYLGNLNEIKHEMQKVLEYIYLHF